MNIDERLGALTQSLELPASLHQELQRQTAAPFAETLGFINRVAHIAEAREQRLDHNDHRLDDLEKQ